MAYCHVISLVIAIYGYLFTCTSCNFFEISSNCAIYITLSPTSAKIEDTLLDINWGPDCRETPPFIGFYRSDPSVSFVSPETIFRTDSKSTGRIRTNIRLGKLHFPSGWNRNETNKSSVSRRNSNMCLPFYIASYFKKNFETINCLRIQPNWMTQMDNLAEVRFDDIFLPGSHASGAFTNDTDTSTLKRFSVTQNFDVWTQLVFGVRYLDISVTYSEQETDEQNRFWIINDGVLFNPLRAILTDVRAFVKRSDDVVILDFAAFGMPFRKNRSLHKKLLKFLKLELGDIVFFSANKKLNDLTLKTVKDAGKSLIVAYNEHSVSKDQHQHIVYPSWKQYSTSLINMNDMQRYIRKMFTRKFREQLSPKKNGWIFVLSQGVDSAYSPEYALLSSRERAYLINRNITTWLGGPWGLTANVIEIDFILSSNIIDIAIYNNRNKKSAKSKGYVMFDMP